MYIQDQVLSVRTTRRPYVLVALGTSVAAVVTVGAIALTTGDSSHTTRTSAPTPSVAAAPGRVLDGSPILRGTATATPSAAAIDAATKRVLDGSPILRGTASPAVRVRPTVSIQAQRRPDGFQFKPGATQSGDRSGSAVWSGRSSYEPRRPQGFRGQP